MMMSWTAWLKSHGPALVGVGATLGTLTHELVELTGQQGVLDPIEAMGGAIAILAALVASYTRAAKG